MLLYVAYKRVSEQNRARHEPLNDIVEDYPMRPLAGEEEEVEEEEEEEIEEEEEEESKGKPGVDYIPVNQWGFASFNVLIL